MTIRSKALIWAAIIISAALIAVGLGFDDGTSFGVIGGLSGAALGSLASEGTCVGGCAQ